MKSPRKKEKRPLASKAPSNGSTEASQDQRSKSSSIVERLQGLLGNDIILLPIPPGGKKPIRKNWQDTTLTQMQDQEYLPELKKREQREEPAPEEEQTLFDFLEKISSNSKRREGVYDGADPAT